MIVYVIVAVLLVARALSVRILKQYERATFPHTAVTTGHLLVPPSAWPLHEAYP